MDYDCDEGAAVSVLNADISSSRQRRAFTQKFNALRAVGRSGLLSDDDIRNCVVTINPPYLCVGLSKVCRFPDEKFWKVETTKPKLKELNALFMSCVGKFIATNLAHQPGCLSSLMDGQRAS